MDAGPFGESLLRQACSLPRFPERLPEGLQVADRGLIMPIPLHAARVSTWSQQGGTAR